MNEPMSDDAIRESRRSEARIAPEGRWWIVAVFVVIAAVGLMFGWGMVR